MAEESLQKVLDPEKPEAPARVGAGNDLEEGQSLHSTLRRGWHFGGEAFREKLLEKLGKLKPEGAAESRRKGYSAQQVRDHGQREAKRIIKAEAEIFEISRSGWAELLKAVMPVAAVSASATAATGRIRGAGDSVRGPEDRAGTSAVEGPERQRFRR